MFFRSLQKTLFVMSVAVLLAATGCRGSSGDDSYRNEQSAKLITQGKSLLAKNQWGLAKETFQRVLDQYDDQNSEARFGLALADLLSFTDTIRLVSSLTSSFSSSKADEENRFVNQLITDLVHDLRAKFVEIDHNLLLVEANPGFKFYVKDLPIYLSNGSTPSENLKGEWDRADVFLLNALVKGVIGVLDYADSVDLNLDVLRAYDYFSALPSDPTLADYEGLVAYVLNDPNYPTFLSVKADGGNELVAEAASNLGAAVRDFQIALYMVSLETDDQSDDILAYDDRNANGRYDPAIDPDTDKCAHLAAQLKDDPKMEKRRAAMESSPENFVIFGSTLGSTKDLPYLSEQTACLLQKTYYGLAWDDVKDEAAAKDMYPDGAPRINFQSDLVPLLDSVVAAALDGFESDDATTKAAVALVARQGLLTNLVGQLFGNAIEIDLHAFMTPNDGGKAGNVRGLLPVWTNDRATNVFALEMECSPTAVTFPVTLESVFDKLDIPACGKTWNAGDAAHFDADAARLAEFDLEPIAADGFIGYLPYIAFQDASMHGLLWLNMAAMADVYKDASSENEKAVYTGLRNLDSNITDFAPASLTDLNAFIGALSANGVIKGLIVK
jgi:hypothetical protein